MSYSYPALREARRGRHGVRPHADGELPV